MPSSRPFYPAMRRVRTLFETRWKRGPDCGPVLSVGRNFTRW
jgi:hypothetical protein